MIKIFALVFLFLNFINSIPIDESLTINNESDDLQYNLNVVEGDMLFAEEGEQQLENARNANIKARKWENGIIPFVIDSNSRYSTTEMNVILQSMKTIETQSNGCLRFKPRTSEANYIVIRHTNTGCNSYIGKIGRGAQQVSIQKPGCVATSVVMHELLHVAGFEHEQNRPDRDNYVDIQWGNIQNGAESQFRKLSTAIVSTLGQPYDINSIMHYRYNAFTKNRQPTITSKVRNVATTDIGVKNVLSATDIKKIKLFYGCPA